MLRPAERHPPGRRLLSVLAILLLLAATSVASLATYRLSASDTDWTRPPA